ncbi:MAG: hypothetical protein IKD66_13055, partial [Solobacterium sp.]|nr:hypothetical protein [Solobacterium sp.]
QPFHVCHLSSKAIRPFQHERNVPVVFDCFIASAVNRRTSAFFTFSSTGLTSSLITHVPLF